jgi:hypothetical protein
MKLLMIILAFYSFASLKTDDETASIYRQSLQLYLSNTKADTVYVLKCFDIKLPSKVGKCYIMDIENSGGNLIKEKGSIYAVKVMPIELKKNIIEVTLVEFLVSEENNERRMQNSGSQTFSYKYDTAVGEYKLIKRTKNAI